MITLRPYQETARFWVNRQLNQGNNPLLIIPTGGGKSPTSAKISEDRISIGNKIFVLVPQYELFNQMLIDYSHLNPGFIDDTGINGRNRNIYICMIQSLVNIINVLPEKFSKSITELFIDEAHFSGAATWEKVFDHFSHAKRFGFTATPYRYDNKPLGKYFDCMFEPLKMSECINAGYLSKPIIIIPEEYKDYVPKNPNDENGVNKDIIQKGKIIGDMVKLYRNVFNGEPVIIPCTITEHAKEVTEMYRNDGWTVDHIHSGLTKHERSRIIRDVRKGKTNILTTVGVGIFGLNIVGLRGIIWLRYTESLTIFMQLNGRAARIMKNKKEYILVDPVGNCVIHGTPDIDRKWSLMTDYIPGQDTSIEAPTMKICPICSVANSEENNNCWICGFDFETGEILQGKKNRRIPKFINGNLVWLEENHGFTDKDIDDYIHNSSDSMPDSDPNKSNTDLTKRQKIDILKRDLIGIRNKSKFREGIKWL